MMKTYIWLVFLLLFYSCDREKLVPPYLGMENDQFELPFKLNVPDTIFELNKALNEISGLTRANEVSLFAVNDEKANLFTISLDSGDIIDEFDFGKNNDYEGVTVKDSVVYVVESNGNISVIDIKKRDKIGEFKTYLSKRNDVEGICLSGDRQSLYLACKGETEKETGRGLKGIYRFDLESKELAENPALIIDLKASAAKLKEKNIGKNVLVKLSLKNRLGMFGPSAIDIDPISGFIYILSNRGKMLVVSNNSNEVVGIYFLSNRKFGQPEGLCFDLDGNLYISNEARSKKANFYTFKRIRKESN